MSIERIEDPIHLKIQSKGKIYLSVGTVESLTEAYNIGKPVYDSLLPELIKDKYQFDSVEIISSKEFSSLMKRVQDSNSRVTFL